MTKFAMTEFPVLGTVLCFMFCASTVSDLVEECSDVVASGVCSKRGKSMLQMSSSVAAVHSEESPHLSPDHHESIKRKHQRQQRRQQTNDWTVISATAGCEDNDDNIIRTYFGYNHSLESCKGRCVLDPQCRAIDFSNVTGFCNIFNQPCLTPKTTGHDQSSYAFKSRIDFDPCNMVKMIHKSTFEELPLRPRASPARVVDFSQIAFDYELPILQMRLAEMGPYVDEFHIAEGNHDFSGKPKEFVLPRLLDADQDLAKWRHKIVHHKVKTTDGNRADTVWEAQIVKGSGVVLEGDLDEIMSRTLMRTLRHCEPIDGNWNASVQMPFLQWNMGWTPCKTCTWWDATIVHDIGTYTPSRWGYRRNAMSKDEMLATKREASSHSKTTNHLLVQVDGRPAGWHVSWTLNSAKGLANKYLHGWSQGGWVGVHPPYLKPHVGNETELAKFLDEKFLHNPGAYDAGYTHSSLTMRDLPESVIEDPDKFKTQLGPRLYDMVVDYADR